MTPAKFVDELCRLSLPDTFNPYIDRCPVYDYADAPKRRAKALSALLKAATEESVDSLWIGRDLGYRGGRRTGLALTDDIHISAHAARWRISAERATKGTAIAERTAAVIWSALNNIPTNIFLWNVFPLHPHEPDDQFSNRAHNRSEAKIGLEILRALICLIKPKMIIAIGNDAANVAVTLDKDINFMKVRHPSYGGQAEFSQQISEIYNIKHLSVQKSLPF